MASNLTKLIRSRKARTNERFNVARNAILDNEPGQPIIPRPSPAQEAFEAEVLESVGYGLTSVDSNTGATTPFGVEQVRPTSESLAIFVAAGSKGSFIEHIRPIVCDDQVSGISGLRVEFSRNCTWLRKLGTTSKVLLANVSPSEWREAAQPIDPSDTSISELGVGSALSLVDI